MPLLTQRVAVPFARCGVRGQHPVRCWVRYRRGCSLGRGSPNEVRSSSDPMHAHSTYNFVKTSLFFFLRMVNTLGASRLLEGVFLGVRVVDDGSWPRAISMFYSTDNESVASKFGAHGRIACAVASKTVTKHQNGERGLIRVPFWRLSMLVLDLTTQSFLIALGGPVRCNWCITERP
jgi:hypothetical protein